MNELATQASSGGAIVAILIGMAIMWGIDRWYYTRNGRAKVKELEAKARKEMEARLAELEQ